MPPTSTEALSEPVLYGWVDEPSYVVFLFVSIAHAQITHRMLPLEALFVSSVSSYRFSSVCETKLMLQRRKNRPILSPEWHVDFENTSHSFCQMSFSLCVRRWTQVIILISDERLLTVKMSFRRPPSDVDRMTSLRVGNLPFRAHQEVNINIHLTTVLVSTSFSFQDLLPLFEKYGDVGDIYLPVERGSGRSRGFAFVRYYDKRDAEVR